MASHLKHRIQYDPKNDYYKRLGLEASATPEQIQQAYRRLAKQYHPDLNPTRREWATAQFQRLNEAYDILSDPTTKAIYDEKRSPFEWRAQGKNWWDQPHKAEPGYSGIYSQPTRPPKPRAGAWLEDVGLSSLRPTYAATVELIESPYRLVIFFLVLVLCGNLIFISLRLQADDEPYDPDGVNIVDMIGTIPPFAPSSVSRTQICPPAYYLEILKIEASSDKVIITANEPDNQLAIKEASLFWTHRVQNNQPIEIEPQREMVVEIRFGEAENLPDPEYGFEPEPQSLENGMYLLRWTPVELNGRALIGTCDQLISILR